jgi:hypothetical protein
LTTWLDALPFNHLPQGNVLVAHDSLGEAISALVAPTAALAPADVPYLFFVARADGGHEFRTTFAQHQQAIADIKRAKRAKQAK